MGLDSSFIHVPSPTVFAGVINSFNTPFFPLATSLSPFAIFLLSSSNYNRESFFRFINSKSIKTFSFSFFSLVNVFTWLPKASYYYWWRNNAFIHSFLLFPKFLTSALNLAILHPITSVMLCYPWALHSHPIIS